MSNYNCPNAGPDAWRSCAGGSKFVGCCMRDPCATGCDPDNLIPASFNPDLANTIPQLSCAEQDAQYYICPDTTPPFFGCCKSEACGGGCSLDDLVPASLGSDPRATAFFSPTGTPSPTASATPAPEKSSSDGTTIGAAVGGAIGGLLLVAGVVFFVWRRRRRSRLARKGHSATGHPATDSNQPPTPNGSMGPSELSASKSVSMRGSPVPPYSAFPQHGPIFELEDQQQKSEKPKEHLSEPVELEGSSTTSSPSAKSAKRFTSAGLAPFRNKRPASLNFSSAESPKVSPQSATFPGSDRYSRVSSLSPRSPRSPRSPGVGSDAGRPSPTHPPPIIEDEEMPNSRQD